MAVAALAAGLCGSVLGEVSPERMCRLKSGDLEIGFSVELGEPGTNGVTVFDERAMGSFREEGEGPVRCGVWRGHPVCGPDFEVRVRLERSADGFWTYAFGYSGNASARFLRRVRFPVVTASMTPGAAVFVPYSTGQLVHPDWAKIKDGGAAWDCQNGAFRVLRFGALLNGNGPNPSVYLDWRTDGYDCSNFVCHKDRDGFARLSVFYDLPFAEEQRRQSVRPFTGVLREYRGSWWEAAQVYRPWARTRPYCAEMRKRKAERGPLNDVAVWFWNRGASERVIAPVERFAADAGVPVALDWYWWHDIPYDVTYPNFWPPREGVEVFRRAIARLRKAGVYTQVYINGVSRGEDDPDWANGGDDEAWWQCPAAHPGRSPRRCVYNRFANVGLVEMCGEAPVFQRKVREVVRHLVADGGLKAVYIDQIGCTCHNPCFNPKHRHAPGDADAPARGYADFIRAIRAENPGVHLSTEDLGEAYLGLFDSQIVLCDSCERLGGWTDCRSTWTETVPAFQAVFNDLTVLFGAYTMMDGVTPYDDKWPKEGKWRHELDWVSLFPDQFAVELARSAVHGLQPCVHNFRLENIGDPRLATDYAFLVATARWRRENAAFLADALLADPGTMTTAGLTARFCSRGTYSPEGKYRTIVHDGLPAVLHTVWRGKDSAVRAMLVNWTRENQSYRLETPDVRAEGVLPPRSWKTVSCGRQ